MSKRCPLNHLPNILHFLHNDLHKIISFLRFWSMVLKDNTKTCHEFAIKQLIISLLIKFLFYTDLNELTLKLSIIFSCLLGFGCYSLSSDAVYLYSEYDVTAIWFNNFIDLINVLYPCCQWRLIKIWILGYQRLIHISEDLRIFLKLSRGLWTLMELSSFFSSYF